MSNLIKARLMVTSVHDLLRITNTNQNLQKIFIHNLLGWFLQHILQQLNRQIEPFTLRNRWTLRYSSHISFAANSSIFLSELPPSSNVTLASSFHLYEFLLILIGIFKNNEETKVLFFLSFFFGKFKHK